MKEKDNGMTEQNNISSNARDNEQERKRRAAPVVKILLGVLLAIVVVAIVVIALLIHRYHGMLDYQEISSEDVSLAPEPVEFDHILVVGLDKDDPEGGSRTDTMILVTVNPETEEIILTSFLRDLYVEVPENGKMRLGHAHAKGGMALLQKTLRENFDINVDRYVTIDFEAFRAIIDAVGGLELELTETDLKYVYPGEEKQPGKYLLDGAHALVYSYWIENGDDEARTLRQRTIMSLMFGKLQTLSAAELDAMLVETLPKITTDLAEADCYSVLFGLAGLSDYPIRSQQFPFPDQWKKEKVEDTYVITFDLEVNKQLFYDSLTGN